ncbi:MAG TPA: DUF2231 domain-containing protein [Tepidisphaeraceae bacterium]|nr:DUF2231 domain-containing protein [Tepidisphaeraceae bacterium]
MAHLDLLPLADFISALKYWDQSWKIHPILVNFTAALVPVSIGSDILGRLLRRDSLHNAGWWTILYAAIITPFTVIFGWLFWMPDDNGHTNMTIHKWLGSGLAVVILGLMVWRLSYRRERRPGIAYLLFGLCVVGALIFQGVLGGNQTFSGM